MQIEALYGAEYENLVNLAARRLGREQAEDVVQAAFTELLEGVDENPVTFLTRRVQSGARNLTKTAGRRNAILGQEFGTTVDKRPADDSRAIEPREYEAGGTFGFPFNSLGERTWS